MKLIHNLVMFRILIVYLVLRALFTIKFRSVTYMLAAL